MNIDDLPLTREQLTIVGMAVALVTVVAAAPVLLAPASNPATESATNGTVYTENAPETDQRDDAGDDGPMQDLSNDQRQPETDLSKVPDSHVRSNGTAPPVSASTGAQTLRVSTMRIDGKPALNLTDSRQHDGRWVSVTTAWLKSEYGTVPEVVGVRHESGGSYTEAVHVREEKAVFWVRGFSTNVVTFGGVLEIVGQPSITGTTHLYEIGDLDDASDPTIDLTGQVNTERDTKQVLSVSNGETIPLSVAADRLQPQNPEVTFTGVEQQSTDNSLFSTVLADGGSTDYSIDGNVDATDVSVTFTGYETTTDQTITASNRADGETFDLSVGGTRAANATTVTFTGDSSTSSESASGSNLGNGDTFGYSIDGNRDANDVTVRFEGDSTTASGSGSGTGSGSINVGGNIDSTGESVSVTGRETTSSGSGSGTGSGSVSVGGNLNPSGASVSVTGRETTSSGSESASNRANGQTFIYDVGGNQDATGVSVTFNGDETSSSQSDSATGVGPDSSQSINVGGNLDPTSETLSVTANVAGPYEQTHYSSGVNKEYLYGDTRNDNKIRSEARFVPSQTGIATGLTFDTSYSNGGNYGISVDVYLVQEMPDTTHKEGTLVKSGWNPDFAEESSETINFDQDYSVTAGQDYTVEFVTTNTDNDGSADNLKVYRDNNPGGTYWGYDNPEGLGTKSVAIDASLHVTPTADLAVSDGAGESVDIGTLTDGESTSVGIDLTTSSSKLDWSSSGAATSLDWSLDWTRHTATEDPAVDLDGDGSDEASYNGILMSGQTATDSAANLSPGSHTATVSTTAYRTDLTVDWTERTATEDPSIDVDGDGTDEASWTGVYAPGQTTSTKSVNGLTTGSNSVSTSITAGPQPDWSLSWTERTGTEDPAIDVDGDGTNEASWSGVFASGQTTSTKSVDGLSAGSVSVETSTTVGPQPDWSLDWTAVTATEDPSIDIDGDGTDEVTYSGILTSGEMYSASVSNLSPGSHTAMVSTGASQVDVTIDYTERRATENPRIDIDGDGSIDASYSGILLDGESVTKQLPNIGTGTHTATVETGYQVDTTVNWTERTTTEDPAIDMDGDGQADASYSGVLPPGDTVTKSVGNLSSGSHTATVSTVHKVGVDAGSTVRTVTEDPTLDIDADGQVEAEYLGQLAEGESQTVQISDFDGNVTGATVGTNAGVVDVQIGYTERVISDHPGVIVNNHTVRLNRTLSQDDTASLTANASWLQAGQNNVTVLASDGNLSTDAPEPTVAITYRHELTTRRTVLFENEAFSERYNISRTYLSSRESATLTIPHAKNIISLRTLQTRIDESGGWTTIPESALTMDGTSAVIDVSSLTGGTVPADTTVEIRSTGSKIDVHNGSVTVVEATPVGFDLDSRVRLDAWSGNSYIGVANTSQGHLLHYGSNESYSAESDYAELSTSHGQRVHFPEASAGSEVGLKTVPLVLSPENGTIRASVPESQTNATAPVFYVSGGERVGDAFTVEYTGASEGEWYGIYEVDTAKRFDRVQGRQAMSVPSDGIDSLIRVKTAPAPETNPEGASTVFEAASQGNLVPLAVMFGAIAGLVIVGRRPERSRATVDGVAERTASLVESIPSGELVSGPVETVIATVGEWIVTVGENELLTGAIGLATVAAAIQSGLLEIGPEAGAIGTVGAIAVGSLLVLTRTGEFTMARWLGIVIVSGVVSLQALGEGDLLTTLIESDAFVLVLILVGYVAVQLVREYRANNSPDDDQPQINIVAGRRGGDD